MTTTTPAPTTAAMDAAEEQLQRITELTGEVGRLTVENGELKAEIARLTAPPEPSPLPPPSEFVFSGRAKGLFSIEGKGFGDNIKKGFLMVGGRTVHATRWKDTSIKGAVPEDLSSGPVEVVVNGTKVQAVLT